MNKEKEKQWRHPATIPSSERKPSLSKFKVSNELFIYRTRNKHRVARVLLSICSYFYYTDIVSCEHFGTHFVRARRQFSIVISNTGAASCVTSNLIRGTTKRNSHVVTFILSTRNGQRTLAIYAICTLPLTSSRVYVRFFLVHVEALKLVSYQL